jgi:sugar-specific transcriptional regulator TrmB/DNA-binding CsgD family transcriptional regulator
MEPLLQPVGLGADESLAYRQLLASPRLSAPELAETLSLSVIRVRRALANLGEAGLVTRIATTSPPRYMPSPPDLAIDALALRRQEELERLRAHARELAMTMADPPRGGPADLVELVEGSSAVLAHLSRMQLGAEREVCVVDCPPYLTGSPAENPEERQAMRRGVRYRAIYHAPTLELPDRMDQVLVDINAGEEARAMPDVRHKMIIVDRRTAMIPLGRSDVETGARILIHPSPLLDILVACFQMLWERATPIAATPHAPKTSDAATTDAPGEQDRKLLAMLAAGMKDRATARALGVTERTVTRRITHLMQHLGAQTRFQAALQAAKRGWL